MTSQPPAPARTGSAYAPVLTPFHADLSINTPLFIRHCKSLLGEGAGLAVFGTNSEANSLTLIERLTLLDALIDAGIDPRRLMPGTGCCSLAETAQLTSHALSLGASKALVLPPFFYAPVSDDGLFDYYSALIERVACDRLSIYLYHIPAMTQVPITCGLVERLLAKYPNTVRGLKDSSGNWANTERMLKEFAASGFEVYCASEVFLSDTLRLGGAGCVSATVNVNARGIVETCLAAGTAMGATLQAEITGLRQVFQKRPLIQAMKGYLADKHGEPSWGPVRPPLVAMRDEETRALLDEIDARSPAPA